MSHILNSSSSDLANKAKHGVRWTAISAVGTNLVTVIQLSILARILTPADYGLMGMALVVQNLVQTIVEMGFGAALIQRKDPTREEIATLYSSNIALGVLGFVCLFFLSPVVAWFYKEPELTVLLRCSAASFLILPWGQVYQALLQKNIDFSSIARAEIFSSVIGSPVAILSAMHGCGVYALVWGFITSAFVRVFFCIVSARRFWKFQFFFSKKLLMSYFRFGFFQTSERIVNFLTANMPYILVGKFCGTSALGVYRVAYELAVTPLMRINPVITRVLFPVLAKLQDDNEQLRFTYLNSIKTICLISLPLYFGMIVAAPDIIHILYGHKWDDAIPLLRILAIIGISKTLANPSGCILLAKGRTDVGFYLNFILFILSASVFYWASHINLTVVALSWILLESAYWLIAWHYTYVATIQLSIMSFLRTLTKPFLLGAFACTCCLLLLVGLTNLKLNLWVRFPFVVSLGVILYIGLCLKFERDTTSQILRLFRSKN